MDTSAEYALMCEKAEEIQANAPNLRARDNDTVPYEEGNWYAQGDIVNTECRYWYEKIPPTWLPRQDQLQEMVIDPLNAVAETMDYFYSLQEYGDPFYEFSESAVPHFGGKYWSGLTTLERFWLAMVMAYKHRKKWNGMDWRQQKAPLQTVGVGHTVK